MAFKLATLSEPGQGVCAACQQQKRLAFEAYYDTEPQKKWRICYACFRLPEDQLRAALKDEKTPA
jgi:hypothetical protein